MQEILLSKSLHFSTYWNICVVGEEMCTLTTSAKHKNYFNLTKIHSMHCYSWLAHVKKPSPNYQSFAKKANVFKVTLKLKAAGDPSSWILVTKRLHHRKQANSELCNIHRCLSLSSSLIVNFHETFFFPSMEPLTWINKRFWQYNIDWIQRYIFKTVSRGRHLSRELFLWLRTEIH